MFPILYLGAAFQGASLRKYPILPKERSTFDKVGITSLCYFLKDRLTQLDIGSP